jgi:hypothetical protein
MCSRVTLLKGVGVIRSRATLIVAPSTLIGQWERNLRDKHVDGPQLRILKVSRVGSAEWKPFDGFSNVEAGQG